MKVLMAVSAMAAVAAALGLEAGSSAPAAEMNQPQALPMAAPKLKCEVKNVRLERSAVVASGGCRLGTKAMPAKWGWISKAADLSGAPCEFGSGVGPGRQSPLPKTPPTASNYRSGGLPGQYSVRFTVSAKAGNQTARDSAIWSRRSPGSRVYCGTQPKPESVEGSQPSALTWGTPPSFDGQTLRAGTIRSVGNGQCRWVKMPVRSDDFYLVFGRSYICDNRTDGHITFRLEVPGLDGKTCYRELKGISSFVLPPEWGPGKAKLFMEVISWVEGTKGYNFSWNTEVNLNGTKNPCADWR